MFIFYNKTLLHHFQFVLENKHLLLVMLFDIFVQIVVPDQAK